MMILNLFDFMMKDNARNEAANTGIGLWIKTNKNNASLKS